MSRGSEQPAWRWTTARNCDDCGKEVRLKDIGRFHYDRGDSIRCMDCVNARVAAFVLKTRKGLGLAA